MSIIFSIGLLVCIVGGIFLPKPKLLSLVPKNVMTSTLPKFYKNQPSRWYQKLYPGRLRKIWIQKYRDKFPKASAGPSVYQEENIIIESLKRIRNSIRNKFR